MRSKFTITALLILLLCSISAFADWDKPKRSGKSGYLKKDRIFQDHINIYDQEGSNRGYLKSDRLFENKTNIYNKDGQQKGYLKRDNFFNDTINIYGF